LADFAAKAEPRLLDPRRSKITLMLKELVARRRQLIDVCVMQKNQLLQASMPEVKTSVQAVLDVVNEQIAEVDRLIQKTIDDETELTVRTADPTAERAAYSGTSRGRSRECYVANQIPSCPFVPFAPS
jgi:hypothetical protein